jgi:hypothetical protein
MRKLQFVILALLYLAFIPATLCWADWVQDGGSWNLGQPLGSHPSLAVSNGTPYVACMENNQLHVKHWNGGFWEQYGGNLMVNAACHTDQIMASSSDGIPYVAWIEVDPNNGFWNLYVKHWNGYSWVQDGGSVNGSAGVNSSGKFSLFVYNATPYVAWTWWSSGGPAILYVSRLNNGAWVQIGPGLTVPACLSQPGFLTFHGVRMTPKFMKNTGTEAPGCRMAATSTQFPAPMLTAAPG